ncbi:MAG TPA: amino acid adenylation domain-containing protein [Bryobacteraceae bacterium]|nr:amino acid adenylation domain-containing protein [Bryobacteraceae bacterium]
MTGQRSGSNNNGSEVARRIAALSPEKRALLEARLGNREAPDAGLSREAPLSFAQERIYKLARADSESNFFVSVTRIRIPSAAGLPAVRAALTSIAQRHEALRSELTADQGRPVLMLRAALPGIAIIENTGEGRLEEQVSAAMAGVRMLEPPLFRSIVSAAPGSPIELFLVTHAILCDGPSLAVLRRELLSICLAHAQGHPLELPPVRTQPADHAREQRRRLQGPRIERLVERWRHLELAPGLALHTDRSRVPKRLPTVARCGWLLSADRVARAGEVAGALGVSAAALWAAAASITLSRFARQSQIVIGVQVSNRARPELQGFVGVAAGAIPVSLEFGADPGFRELAARADAELRAAAAAEELPHEKLAQELRLQRSDRQHPLFQVVLALRSEVELGHTGDAPLEAGEYSAQPASPWFSSGSVHFDLAIAVDDMPHSSGVELLYDAHLFNEESVSAIAQSLDVLIEAALNQPDEPVSNLPLLGPVEDGTFAGRVPLPPPAFASTIHGLFERRAALDPNRVALQGDGTLSYAELNARTNRLGRALLTRGVKHGDVVGVCIKRSTDLVTSFLAIMKIGAVYLPLDPLYPAERLNFMIQDSGARLLLHRGAALEQITPGCDTVDLATLDTSLYAGSNLDASIGGREAAYLMYTSGSTGQPKGVLVQHLGVCHVADAQVEKFDLTTDDQILQFASPSFDASIFEMVMAPRCGGVLHLAAAEDLMPGPPLVQLLKARRITVLTMPPSALAAVPPIELPDLRIVVSAGEACPAELVARWAPGRRFFNAYGPTEASIWATVAECAPSERSPSIGAPLPHVLARVVDDRLRPVPVGAPGELLLGGPGVALGYQNRPELTAERFLEPADTGDGDDRWYRTGDLVRRDSLGSFWHLGRVDRQVKVRGFRIEPGEIEACLLELPGVRSAAVEVEQSNLVAYYVSESPLDAQVLQHALAQRLPRHLVPASFIGLQAMPLGSNGKLDRSVLQRQSRPRLAGLQPPRTATETALMDIWKGVLRIEKLGIEDNFFDLGGHSLLAASVMSRAAAALGRELPLQVMFRSPTIAQLAQVFDSAELARKGSAS